MDLFCSQDQANTKEVGSKQEGCNLWKGGVGKVKGARCLNPPLIISIPGVSRSARENLKLARREGWG